MCDIWQSLAFYPINFPDPSFSFSKPRRSFGGSILSNGKSLQPALGHGSWLQKKWLVPQFNGHFLRGKWWFTAGMWAVHFCVKQLHMTHMTIEVDDVREWSGRIKQYNEREYMAVCQNLVPLVNIKIAGKWMFIPLKMVLIGIDP